jgi:hypothetical protein
MRISADANHRHTRTETHGRAPRPGPMPLHSPCSLKRLGADILSEDRVASTSNPPAATPRSQPRATQPAPRAHLDSMA